jgi:tetratricopeptide (TPR) repeat protein
MLTKAMRIPEIDVLFKLRYFIQNFVQWISSSPTDSSLNTVYRCQSVSTHELKALQKHADGGLIAFHHFFVASVDPPKSTARPNDEDDGNGRHEIVFVIDLANSQSYALLAGHVLFTFGLVVRLERLSRDKNGTTLVHVSIVSSEDRHVKNIVGPMRKEIRAPYPVLRLVKLFIELHEYSQANHLGQILLADCPTARRDTHLALARVLHSLGTKLYEHNQYDEALDTIKKSHALYVRYLPDDSPQLSPTWNNMGSIYLRQGKTELALTHHEKALAIQLSSPSPDLSSIISYSNNIGGVYLKMERFDEALVHFQRALKIEERTLSKNDPELAGTYHRIGGIYFRKNEFEQALEYYDKTLQIELAAYSNEHPTVAVTYHNRGTALEGLGRLEEAVESAESAVKCLRATMSEDHPQVQLNQAYVDRLKQKLWVKQLFTN